MLSLSPEAATFLKEEIVKRKILVFSNFLFGVFAAVLEVTGIGLVFPLLAVIMQPNSLDSMPIVKNGFNYFGVDSQKELTLFLAITIALVMTIKSVYMIAFYRWQSNMIATWKSEVSRRIMRLYLMSDYKIHMEKTPSEMIRNLSLTGLVFDQYIIALLNVMINATVGMAIAGLLFVTLPIETLFSVGILVITAVIIYKLTKGSFWDIGQESNALYKLRNICLNQAIGAIRESKILGKENYFLDSFTSLELKSFDRQGHYNFLASLPGIIMEAVIIIAMIIVVVNVVFVSNEGVESLAIVGLLTAAMFRMLPMVIRSMSNIQLMSMGRPSLELIALEISTYEHRVVESRVSQAERFTNWNCIELCNVGYSYPNGTKALADINMKIYREQFIGITGASGSGKSTLLMILLGLIEPTEGKIFVDEVALRDVDSIRRWQNGIGYVPQGIFLIDGTVAANVAFGDDDPDLERVRWAIEVAQLGSFLDQKAKGINEEVGEYGALMSGGQKQRIVIARSLYRDPDIVAFDEATAAMDAETERALTEGLKDFKAKKTMLAIAHRLSTIKSCDCIIYLEQGKLTGFGTFADLKISVPGFANLSALSNL